MENSNLRALKVLRAGPTKRSSSSSSLLEFQCAKEISGISRVRTDIGTFNGVSLDLGEVCVVNMCHASRDACIVGPMSWAGRGRKVLDIK